MMISLNIYFQEFGTIHGALCLTAAITRSVRARYSARRLNARGADAAERGLFSDRY